MKNFFSLIFGVAVVLSPQTSIAAENWTSLARKVGQSETEAERTSAIKQLKKNQHLSKQLRQALHTSDRPLALEVISALDIKALIPDLLKLVPADPDGFLTVALNSMITDQNRKRIFAIYEDALDPRYLVATSAGAIVGMLEPMGRLDVRLSRPTLVALSKHGSPEVRSSLLYYLRIMALRNRVFENLDLVQDMTKAREFQVRLQAVSVSNEIAAARNSSRTVARSK